MLTPFPSHLALTEKGRIHTIDNTIERGPSDCVRANREREGERKGIEKGQSEWLPPAPTGAGEGGAPPPGRHPLMHRSRSETDGSSTDYAICLEGSIYCVLDDDSEVLMHAGDTMIQRGTNHAWKNSFGEPCRMAFVLVDGSTG